MITVTARYACSLRKNGEWNIPQRPANDFESVINAFIRCNEITTAHLPASSTSFIARWSIQNYNTRTLRMRWKEAARIAGIFIWIQHRIRSSIRSIWKNYGYLASAQSESQDHYFIAKYVMRSPRATAKQSYPVRDYRDESPSIISIDWYVSSTGHVRRFPRRKASVNFRAVYVVMR